MKNLTLLSTILFAVLLSSCSKEGPAGPAGPQGPTGNANVVSGEWSVAPGDWQACNGISNCYYVFITDTAISLDIINYGAVLAYYVQTDNNQNPYLLQLPFTYSSGEIIAAFAELGTEEIDLKNTSTAPGGDMVFKIVTLSGQMLHLHPELKAPNVPYEVVKQYVKEAQIKTVNIKAQASKQAAN